MYNTLGAFDTVVIPASSLVDFETFMATLDAVPGVALTIMGALSNIYLKAGDKRFNSRHQRPP